MFLLTRHTVERRANTQRNYDIKVIQMAAHHWQILDVATYRILHLRAVVTSLSLGFAIVGVLISERFTTRRDLCCGSLHTRSCFLYSGCCKVHHFHPEEVRICAVQVNFFRGAETFSRCVWIPLNKPLKNLSLWFAYLSSRKCVKRNTRTVLVLHFDLCFRQTFQ